MSRRQKYQAKAFGKILTLGTVLTLHSPFDLISSELPLWELGLGFLTFKAGHYRGSNQDRSYFWPLPYFIYRGEKVEAEPSFIRGNLYKKGPFTLGLSLNASLSVNSERNQARENMPPLDPSVEIGPLLIWDLWMDANQSNLLSFYWPMRKVQAVNFWRMKSIGTFTVPYLAFISNPQTATQGFYSEVTYALMFASRKFHEYYYGVPPEHARLDRPAYQAHGGYSGQHVTWYLSRKFHDFFGFAFVRYDRLEGAAFEEGPLLKKKSYLVFGGGLVFFFLESSKRVNMKIMKY